MPFTIVSQGSITQPSSAASALTIPLPSGADWFKTWNITQLGTTQGTGRTVMSEWFNDPSIVTGGGLNYTKTNSTNALNVTTYTSPNGFTYVTQFPTPGPAVTASGGGTITNANPAVVTMTNTFTEGQRVWLYGTTGMLQISGMLFSINNVSGSAFTLEGLNASGFASAATAATARSAPTYLAVEPEFLYITGITQATQAVVTVSTNHSYQVGMNVTFQVPASFGMTQISNLTGTIVAIGLTSSGGYPAAGNYNNFTVNINSSAFTAFAFPASTGSPTTQLFATVAPAGQKTQYNPINQLQTGYNFNYSPFHSGLFLPFMYVPSGASNPAGSASDVILFQAGKWEQTTNSTYPL